MANETNRQGSTEENLVKRLRDNRGDDPAVTGRLEEEAANALASALSKLAACEPYLKEDETPAECIERNRKDAQVTLTLLAREKRKNEQITDWVRKASEGDSSIQGAFIEIEAICNG